MSVSRLKRRAIVALFLHGFSFVEVGQALSLPSLLVENVFRDWCKAERRVKP